MIDTLADTLNSVGKETERCRFPDGSTVLVLPYGGRILGLFAPGAAANFYWTHPALESERTAAAFYASDDWHNSGGDRTWLAPEVDIFFPNFPNRDTYFQPRQLDPGDYALTTTDRGLELTNRLTVMLSRSRRQVELQITKLVSPAPNPLRRERGLGGLSQIEYAGYTLRTSLELLGRGLEPVHPVGLWNLVQMPHGGDLLIPTYVRTEPKVYFGEIADLDLIVSDRLVRYRMRASGEHKIGVRAVATAGRVGYLHQMPDRQWALIIRNFLVDPSGEYVDVPWDEPEDMGYSTQACNVNSALGSFSELEYHVPAIGGSTGKTRTEDVAQVWAFRGARETIQAIAACLLTAELSDES
ncbi:MAG: hypothetical protein JXQ73_24765 [Phycisphaerae bacterium]|nr:hypothetical protein [Phycisphaerae bacterium]